RHTRLQGDWSSDVCSSDLTDRSLFGLIDAYLRRNVERLEASLRDLDYAPEAQAAATSLFVELADFMKRERAAQVGEEERVLAGRSEERRVGKEWRARWAAE